MKINYSSDPCWLLCASVVNGRIYTFSLSSFYESWTCQKSTVHTRYAKNFFPSSDTYIWRVNFDPSRWFIIAAILKTECHWFFVAFPFGNCVPGQFDGLRFEISIFTTGVQSETFHSCNFETDHLYWIDNAENSFGTAKDWWAFQLRARAVHQLGLKPMPNCSIEQHEKYLFRDFCI